MSPTRTSRAISAGSARCSGSLGINIANFNLGRADVDDAIALLSIDGRDGRSAQADRVAAGRAPGKVAGVLIGDKRVAEGRDRAAASFECPAGARTASRPRPLATVDDDGAPFRELGLVGFEALGHGIASRNPRPCSRRRRLFPHLPASSPTLTAIAACDSSGHGHTATARARTQI